MTNQSLTTKTISEILECFSLKTEELGINEIARKLNYYPSKIHRIISTLENYGFLEKNQDSKKYRIGLRFLQIGLLYPLTHSVTRIARPHAMEIAKTFTTNVQLGVLSKYPPYCVVIIDSIINFDPTIISSRIGNNIPLYCSSLGKALLAFSDDQLVDSIIQSIELKNLTPATITDKKQLRKEIRITKDREYALDRGEVQPDFFCIGTPIRDNNGLVAAISVSDRSEKIKKMQDELIEKLLNISKVISYQLGYMISF